MDGIVIETGLRPGLLGAMVGAHGVLYARDWGFGQFFESKVARECAGFLDRLSDDDLCMSAWQGGAFVGSLVIDRHDPGARADEAHLRWFIVTAPGRGLGARLMERAMAFLDASGLRCFLTTFAGLDAARTLYERHGFALVEQRRSETWGTVVDEQRFERPITEKTR